MNTKRNARIRKVFYGLVIAGMLIALLGAGGLPAAHAQEGEFPTLPPDKVMPGGFEKDEPDDGATFSATSPITLSWDSSSHADRYFFCYDTTDNDRCDSGWYWSDDTNFTINATHEDLAAGVTYYWQAMACTSGDPKPSGCYEADDGDWWSFTTSATTIYSTGSQDGWILESTETSSTGGSMDSGSSTFRLGDDASDRQYRSILSFNTSGLPDDAVITSAKLQIKQYGSEVGLDPFSELGNLYASIRKGYFGSSSSLQLADFSATATSEKIATFGAPSSSWYTATLTSTGRGKINKTGLTQFRLFFNTGDNDNNSADYMRFYSGDSSGNKPRLVLKYTIP